MRYKTVLDIGLQAANKMQTFSSQTYYNRMVNASTQFNAADLQAQTKLTSNEEATLKLKLDRFMDKVSYIIEGALSSNEIINVFQDDFQMLGDEEAAVSA